MWTQFYDMHTGGCQKISNVDEVFIEAPRDEAEIIFRNRFGLNPYKRSCHCCGDDYSITEGDDGESLAELTGYERGCATEGYKYVERWNGYGYSPYIPFNEYIARESVLVIAKEDIPPELRQPQCV
jgi:hypothetical protein